MKLTIAMQAVKARAGPVVNVVQTPYDDRSHDEHRADLNDPEHQMASVKRLAPGIRRTTFRFRR